MARRGRPPYPDVLTPREWEVLAMLREGLSNDQIGERLGFTERTAKYHVSEILGKLGVSSRQEAAGWDPAQKPWWMTGLAPVGFLWGKAAALPAKMSAIAMTVSGAAVVAALGGLGLLAFLLASDGGGSPATVAPDREERVARLAFAAGGSIYTVGVDGSDLRGIPGGLEEDRRLAAPAFSPDGTQIVFTRDLDVWIATAEGQDARLLADVGEFVSPPGAGADTLSTGAHSAAWSPGGDRIMYTLARVGGSGVGDVWLMEADGSEREQIHISGSFVLPTWLDSGRIAVYEGNGRVRVFGLTGEEETSVDMPGEDRSALTAARTADGRWLVGPFINEGPILYGAPSNMRKIATGVSPALSPDGRWFAYFQGESLRVAALDGSVDGEVSELLDLGYRDHHFAEQPYCFPANSYGCSYRPPVISWSAGEVRLRADSPGTATPEPLAVIDGPGVYVMRQDGSDLRRLPDTGRVREVFAWAPSGNRFALVAGCLDPASLYVGSAETEELEQVASLLGQGNQIFWSPDESTVAVGLAIGPEDAAATRIVDVESGAVEQLEGSASFFGWSYDGRHYAVLEDPDADRFERALAIVNSETGSRTVLGESLWNVLWSPVDDRLAVVRLQGPEEPPYNAWVATGIDVIESDGTGRTTLVPVVRHAVTGGALPLAWSPDGTRLLVRPGTSPFHYLVYDPDAPEQPLDLGETYKLSGAEWSPDGEHLAVERDDPDIFVEILQADGAPVKTIRAGAAAQHPRFSPDGERVVFQVRRPEDWDAQDLYVTDLDGGAANLLARVGLNISNVDWSADGSYIALTAAPITGDGC